MIFKDDNGRCIIYKEDGNEMSEDDWLNGIYLPAIDDNSSKKLLWSLKTKNIKKMQFQFNTNHNNYFNISLDPHSYYLSINLTDEFANYEEYEVKFFNFMFLLTSNKWIIPIIFNYIIVSGCC